MALPKMKMSAYIVKRQMLALVFLKILDDVPRQLFLELRVRAVQDTALSARRLSFAHNAYDQGRGSGIIFCGSF